MDLSLTGASMVAYRPGSLGLGSGEILDKRRAGESLAAKVSDTVKDARFFGICMAAVAFCEKWSPSRVMIERPVMSNKRAHGLADLGGVFRSVQVAIRYQRKMPSEHMTPTAARKIVFGRGTPPKDFEGGVKEWVAQQLDEMFGWDQGEDNDNDALVMALAGANEGVGG